MGYFDFHYPQHLMYGRVPPAVRQKFRDTFGLDLHDYWDLGLDVVKFDDEYLQTRDGQSMEEGITQCFGPEICAWVKGLISGIY